MATQVTVYSESGYSENTFIIKILADINDDSQGPLVSAGVKLTYPVGKLKNPITVKNEAIWYFGSPGSTYSYIEPYSDTPGEIIVLLGKLDIHSPGAGVSENRILLARVTFERIEYTDIPVPSDFTLDRGRIAPFTNFATITGVDLDDMISFNSSTPIITLSSLFLRDSIRSLKVLNMAPQLTPVRSSELDVDGNNRIGLPEAVYYLNKAAD
jgi:hypothetical protein